MDPAAIIQRRPNEFITNLDHCVLCQDEQSRKVLRSATHEGKDKVWTVAEQRKELQDDRWQTFLQRLSAFTHDDFVNSELLWHKDCYCSFTSEHKLQQLRRRKLQDDTCQPSTSMSPPKRRSSASRINWKLCIFCQAETSSRVHSVTFMETSNRILQLSKNDQVMRTRLSGIHDLIAAEGVYHLECWVNFRRKVTKASPDLPEKDTVLQKVCQDLEEGLQRGHVYDMSTVWEKYCEICAQSDSDVPQSFASRRKTFYEKVQSMIGPKATFVRPPSRASVLVFPSEKSEFILGHAMEASINEPETEFDTDYVQPAREQSFHQEIMHVALRLKADLNDMPGHMASWRGIDAEHVEKIIPDSLYLFLRLLFSSDDDIDEAGESERMKQKIYPIAQDIVYAMSNGRKLTPKHTGLGLALHQSTRSESLVGLFNAANHTVGIDTIRRFDTSIAQSILDKYIRNGYVYIPTGIVPGSFVHCSCDNIDILEETIDGKNTFHSTQMVVWQRQTALDTSTDNTSFLSRTRARAIKSQDLARFQTITQSPIRRGERGRPQFSDETSFAAKLWLSKKDTVLDKLGLDFAWLVSRLYDQDKVVSGWKSFNMRLTQTNIPHTKAGLLPILQANPDNYDTMTTVIDRFCDISRLLGQKYTIITADQPLYSKGKEIVWSDEQYKTVIFLMGGFHITCNFLKAIGQHMENAGLDDVWAESGIYAANSTDAILQGKAYYRAIRAHMLTYEALWRILWNMLKEWAKEKGHLVPDVEQLGSKIAHAFEGKEEDSYWSLTEDVQLLQNEFKSQDLQTLLRKFRADMGNNPNFKLWTSYMSMVECLFCFIRAEREGNWLLHLEAFASMLPWVTIYDHHNYARWGPVYLAEMQNLETTAPEVHSEFMAGNFVVKWGKGKFNQVSADHGTEWINRMCKTHNGIIGITRNDQARDKFCITWSQRSSITQDVRHLFGLSEDEAEEQFLNRRDGGSSQVRRDFDDVDKLCAMLKHFQVFRYSSSQEADENDGDVPLLSLATKDVATDEIAKDLLTAQARGEEAVTDFFEKRLIKQETAFFDTLQKQNSKTFAFLYKSSITTKSSVQKEVKADRNLIQRLLNAVNSGRQIDMSEVLRHELSLVPQALALANGKMRSTAKSELLHIVVKDSGVVPEIPHSTLQTCYIVDGHAFIQNLQKPKGCKTFGEYAKAFYKGILVRFDSTVSRIDVVFDRYFGKASIKKFTREERSRQKRPIRKFIDTPSVPLPESWKQFIASDENKEDLARFLAEQLSQQNIPADMELIVGGGFKDATTAWSSKDASAAQLLHANHEEADTRMILHANHAVQAGYHRIIVASSDTDVMVLLLHFIAPKVTETWMAAGSSRERRYYPLHDVAKGISLVVLANLPGFHAFTGCDTTSSFFGFGKKSCWDVYIKKPDLLGCVGRDGPIHDAVQFTLQLYRKAEASGLDEARHQLFTKAKKQLEKLPPTHDALELHFIRANYQAKIWLQSTLSHIYIQEPQDTGGWRRESQNADLEIVWTRLPAVSQSTLEITSCGCTTKCGTARCTCFKSGLACIPACGCDAMNCSNPAGPAD